MRSTRYVRGVSWVLVCPVLCCCAGAFGDAALGVGGAMPEGAFVAVPIEFTPDAVSDTAGLQFDIEIDTSCFEVDSVIAGSAASESGKGVMWSQLNSGRVRVLVAGMNQAAVLEGEVATLYLAPVSTSYDEDACWLEAGICSGPFGDEVPVVVPPRVDDADNTPEESLAAKTEATDDASQQDDAGTEPSASDQSSGANAADDGISSANESSTQDSGAAAGMPSLGGGVARAPDRDSDAERSARGRDGAAGYRLGGSSAPPEEAGGPITRHRMGVPNPRGGASGRGVPPRSSARPGVVPKPPGDAPAPLTRQSTLPSRGLRIARAEEPEWRLEPPSGLGAAERDEARPPVPEGVANASHGFSVKGVAAMGIVGAVMTMVFILRRRWLEPRGARR